MGNNVKYNTITIHRASSTRICSDIRSSWRDVGFNHNRFTCICSKRIIHKGHLLRYQIFLFRSYSRMLERKHDVQLGNDHRKPQLSLSMAASFFSVGILIRA